MIADLRISSRKDESGFLVESEHKIHILDGLAGSSLDEIVDRRKNNYLFPIRECTDIAEVCVLHPLDVRRTLNEPNEK